MTKNQLYALSEISIKITPLNMPYRTLDFPVMILYYVWSLCLNGWNGDLGIWSSISAPPSARFESKLVLATQQ